MQSSLSTPAFKSIVDSPYCTCGAIEYTHHFLFVCRQFTDFRRYLINSVSDICQLNLNVLLCGDISLTFDHNKHLFKAVQEFIIKSKVFNIHINPPITHCIRMKYTSMFEIKVLFKIRVYTNSDAPISLFICINHNIPMASVMFDVRGFNDSNTCWLYRLIFIVRN